MSQVAPLTVLHNASQLVGVGSATDLRKSGAAMRSLGILAEGSLILEGGKISWIGPGRELPRIPAHAQVIDLSGKVVLPGLVDSHTHLIFAGSRADEFEQRLEGLSYQEIAARGGGILSTVRAVRQCSRQQLKALARPRLLQLLAHGVTTAEVKSGYGLSLEDEIKCLEVIAELNAEGPLELVPTFLGAHAVPEEYRSDREGYLRLLTDTLLPEVVKSKLATFCDVFCEEGVFSVAESERVLGRAAELGLRLKIHADELTTLGGAELAGRMGAVSADHLLCISDAGIEALAEADVVASLLPGTALYLRMPYAPARRLIERGVAVALASDCNPGTCPTENLTLIGSLACTQMLMLPAEVVHALTLNAAAAIGCSDRVGSLTVGKQADLAVFNVKDYRELFMHVGVNHVWRVFKKGRLAYPSRG